MSDPWFAAAQKRRSAAEGRIRIFKNVFPGGVMWEKGFENRNRSLIWSVRAHNLWVMARKSLADEADRLRTPENRLKTAKSARNRGPSRIEWLHG